MGRGVFYLRKTDGWRLGLPLLLAFAFAISGCHPEVIGDTGDDAPASSSSSSSAPAASGTAAHLAFNIWPSTSVTAGAAFATQPSVSLVAADGTTPADSSTVVTLSAYSDSGCSVTLGVSVGSGSATAASGVASFAGVNFTKSGVFYLGASTPGNTTYSGVCSGAITVAAASATQLVYTAAPSSTATAGGVLAAQPTVAVEDTYGNVVGSASNSITLAAYTNAACTTAAAPTLAVTTSPLSASSGVANFTGVNYTKTGLIYIGATTSGLTTACSAVTVSPGPATKLSYSTAPSATATAGVSLATQPIVVVQDANSNTVTTSSASIVLGAYVDSSCLTSASPALGVTTSPVSASAGLATFSGVNYTKTGTIYVGATSAGLGSACNAVVVNPNTATKLAFSVEPSSTATAVVNFVQQPTVAVEDTNGNVVTSSSASITLGAFTDSSCSTTFVGTLTNTTATASSGLAAFATVSFNKSGSLYIQATSNGLTSACATLTTVNPAVATKLVYTTIPSSTATAAVTFVQQPVVAVEDANGNIVTGASNAVTLAMYTDSGCVTSASPALIVTTTPLTPTNGLATFSGVKYNKSGSYYVGAVTNGLTSACSAVTVNPGPAAALAFSTNPSTTGTAGVNLASQPIVAVNDAGGNLVTGATNAVTLGAYTDASCLTAAAPTLTVTTNPVSASAGLSTFAGVNYTKSGTYYIGAISGGLTSTCSAAITINPGAATKLVYTTSPSTTATAAVNFASQPVVAIEDANNNVVTSASNAVTLGAYTDSSCLTAAAPAIGATTDPVNATSGVSSFAGVNYTKSGTIYVGAISNGLTTACSALVTVNPGAATQLVFSTTPSTTGTANTTLAQQPIVAVEDASNNIVTSASNSVTLGAYVDSGCLTTASPTLNATTDPVSASAGLSTFAGVKYTKSGIIYIGATTAGLTTACSAAVTINPGAATQLAFTTAPSTSATAGANLAAQPIVAVEDANNNVVTSATNAITLGAYVDSGCLTAASPTLNVTTDPVSASAGLSTFAGVNYTKAGVIYIGAKTNGLTSTCAASTTVNPSTATQLAFTTQPSSTATAGVNVVTQPVASVEDAYNNVVTSASNSVTLGIYTDSACATSATGGTFNVTTNPVSASSGVSSYAGVNYTQTGTYYLGVKSSGLTTGCSSLVTISANSASKLVFSTTPSTTATAGTNLAQQPIVEVEDINGNLVTSATNSITLGAYVDSGCVTTASPALTVGSGPVSAVAGFSTFTGVKYTKTGIIYIGANTAGLSGACSAAITVNPGAATQLAFSPAPSTPDNAGTNFGTQPIVAVEDANGNVVTSASNTVTLGAYTDSGCVTAASPALIVGSGAVSASSGLSTFSGVKYNLATTIYVGANTGGLTGACSSAVVVNAGGATQLAFTTAPSTTATAGTNLAQQPIVAVQDAVGNTVTSASNAITLGAYVDSGCLTAASPALIETTNPVSASSGLSTFAGVKYNKTGTIYIGAITGGLTSACSAAITVNPGVATQLVFSTAPSTTATAGTNFAQQPIVAVEDANNNIVTGASNAVTLGAYVDSGCLTAASPSINATTNPVSASSGYSTFAGVNYTKTATIYVGAISNGLTTACSAAVTVNPGAATKLVFSTAPSTTGTAGVNLATQPIVAVEDANNNVVTGAGNSITLGAYVDSGCLTAASPTLNVTTDPVSASSGLSTFAGVNYTKMGTIYIGAITNGLTTACSAATTISANTASKLAFSTAPSTTATAGTNFATQPIVAVQDTYSNLITGATNAITLGAYVDSGCLTAASPAINATTNPVSASSGYSTFAGVKYNQSGTIYVGATTGSLTLVCSSAVTVNAGAATKLAFTTSPSTTATAGVNLASQPIVAVEDANNNVVTSASNAVTLGAYVDSGCLTAASPTLNATTNPVSVSAGLSTFAGVNYTKTGTIYIGATTNGLTTACSAAISVNANTANKLAFSTAPSTTATAGVNLVTQPIVAVQDTYSNLVTSASNAITLGAYVDSGCLTAASPTLSATTDPVSASAGLSTFAGVNYTKSGTIYIGAITNGLTLACSAAVTVNSNTATKLAFTTAPSTTATAGTNLASQPIVGVEDTNGNVVTSASNAITLGAYVDSGCLTAASPTLTVTTNPVSASAGLSTFAGVNYTKTSTIYVGATTNGLTSACSSAITVNPGVATKLVYTTTPPSTAQVNALFSSQPVVTVEDANSNVVTSASNAVTLGAYVDSGCLTASGTTLTATTDPVSATSGVSSFAGVKYSGSGVIYIGAISNGLTTACSASVTVASGTKLAFTTAPSTSATAGTNLTTQPIVAIEDNSSSVVTTATDSVTLSMYVDSGCLTTASTTLSGTTTVSASAGYSTFTGINYTKAGTFYMGAASGTLTMACSTAITVNASTANKLAFSTQPSSTATAGTAFTTQPIVTIQDTYGNNAGGTNAITLGIYVDNGCATSAAGGTLSVTTNPVNASAGLSTFAGVSYTKSGTYYLKSSTNGLTAACSALITINAAAASQLVFTTQPPATATAGVNFTTQPIVTIEDAYGNNASGSNVITLNPYVDSACATAATGGTLTSNTATASGGIATYSGVNYTKSSAIYLGAASTGPLSGCSTVVVVNPNVATKLAFTTNPSSDGYKNVNILTPPVVAEQDTYGNTVTSATDAITLSAYVDSGCLTLAGGTVSATSDPLSATAGVASFANVQYNQTATIYFGVHTTTLTSACAPSTVFYNAPPTQLVFSGATSAIEQQCSTAITVTAEDSTTAPANVLSNTLVTLAGNNSGSFYTDSACAGTTTTVITITTGNTNSVFFFMDKVVETDPLTANSASLTQASMNFIVKTPVTAIAVGQTAGGNGNHACSVNNGGVVCWGPNGYGQLGTGNTSGVVIPTIVSGLTANVGATTVANGGYHTCSVINGGIQCWGRNDWGQLGDNTTTTRTSPVAVLGLTAGSGVTAVAAHYQHTCAIINGAMKCWGYNAYDQLGDVTATDRHSPVQVSGLTSGVTSIGVGALHSCAVVNNSAKCWGRNANGQLGDGTTTDRTSPVQVSGLTSGVSMIATGWEASCAVTNNTAYCWGRNAEGELGDTTTTQRNSPITVSGLTANVSAIATGYGHSCAVVNGGIYCWGYNAWGQVGEGTTTNRTSPLQVSGMTANSGATAIATGDSMTCALLNIGPYCWGYDGNGNLGNESTVDAHTPVAVVVPESPTKLDLAGLTTVLTGSCTVAYTAFLKDPNGVPTAPTSATVITLSAGGSQSFYSDSKCTTAVTAITVSAPNNLGNFYVLDAASETITVSVTNGTLTSSSITITTTTTPTFNTVALDDGDTNSDGHGCAVNTSYGTVQCWGQNNYGQLGNNATTQSAVPLQVSGIYAGAVQVVAGYRHSCALVSGGVKCWGDNTYGQIGDNTTTQRNTPVQVSGLTANGNVQQIGVGLRHTCAIVNGGAWCWGYNNDGEIGDTTSGTNRLVPVAVNGLSSGGVQMLGSGTYSNCAMVNGGAQCWGDYLNGRLGQTLGANLLQPGWVDGLPPGSGVSFVSAHGATAFAIVNGSLKAWGYNNENEIGDNTATTRNAPVQVLNLTSGVTAVSNSRYTSCAVVNGGAQCWGRNNDGEIGDGTLTNRLVPTQVSGIGAASSGVTQVFASAYMSCALVNGNLKCWGAGGYGETGLGITTNTSAPNTVHLFNAPAQLQLVGGLRLASSTCSLAYSAGLMDSAGYASAAASNTVITLSGSDTTTFYSDYGCSTSVTVLTISASNTFANFYVKDTAAETQTLTISSSGLTNATYAITSSATPADNTVANGAVCSGATSGFSCAIISGGIQCWGDNTYGQIGNGTGQQAAVPSQVSGIGPSSSATQVALGCYHSCGIVNGGVKCWGYNNHGQVGDNTTTTRTTPVQVSGLTAGSGVQQIATGTYQTCAIVNGGMKCWGYNNDDQLGDVTATDRYVPTAHASFGAAGSGVYSIGSGDLFSCAVLNGGVQCWGYTNNGRVGISNTANPNPTAMWVDKLSAGNGVQQIASAWGHNCAVVNNGAQCWGYNNHGQLGNNNTTDQAAPVQVSGLTANAGVTAVTVGPYHSCAIVNGALKCWGLNTYGELGDATTGTDRLTPVAVSGMGSSVTWASNGGEYDVCEWMGGNLYCSGYGKYGQNGNNATSDHSSPQQVTVASSPTQLAIYGSRTLPTGACSTSYSAFLQDSNGNVSTLSSTTTVTLSGGSATYYSDASCSSPVSTISISAGSTYANFYAKDNTTETLSITAAAGGLSSATAAVSTAATPNLYTIAMGFNGSGAGAVSSNHACAVVSGAVQCWGDNASGELGNNTLLASPMPVGVSGITNAMQVAAGGNHSCALLTNNGGIKCWGANARGQLGDGTTTNRLTPVQVSGLGAGSGVQFIAAGVNHTCAIVNSGLQCWGYNGNGRLGDGTNTDRSSPVLVSGFGTSGSGVTAVSPGASSTCMLANGGVYCVGTGGLTNYQDGNATRAGGGTNYTYMLVDVFSPGTAIALGGGYGSNCAINYNGGVQCWGSNTNGQLGNNATTDSYTPVQVSGLTSGATAIVNGGYKHVCALVNGGMQCWGMNSKGQIGDATATDRHVPVTVSGLTANSSTTAIAAGDLGSCALVNGTVKCWGQNDFGQLGMRLTSGSSTPFTSPQTVSTFGAATQLDVEGQTEIATNTCSMAYTVAIQDASAYLSQFTSSSVVTLSGTGNTTFYSDNTCSTSTTTLTFSAASSLMNFYLKNSAAETVAVTASSSGLTNGSRSVTVRTTTWTNTIAGSSSPGNLLHSCAVVNGGAQCWGDNSSGQLGDNTTTTRLAPVVVIAGTSGVTAVATGDLHSCVIINGGVQCWGFNASGQLGDGTTTDRHVPVWVSGISTNAGTQAISASINTTCAVVNSTLKCWGNNGAGQLGDGTGTNRSTPVATINLPTNAVHGVTVGSSLNCATVYGGLVCWGIYNSVMPNSTATTTNQPTIWSDYMTAATGVSVASLGANGGCAIVNGGVKCWAPQSNLGDGQLGNNTTTATQTPVQVSGLTANAGVTAISSNANGHLCAVVNGGVMCWGLNGNGQIGDATSGTNRMTPVQVSGLTANGNAVSIGSGYSYSLSRQSDGTAKSWGYNNYGELGDNTTTQRTSPVSVLLQ